MAVTYRRNSMMEMLDAQPEGTLGKVGLVQDAQHIEQQQDWNDPSDHQSPLRKHLISTYLQGPDEEAMPLLGEYFGVALSFVALGALVRASNSSKRKHKKTLAAEEERLDLRACSKFERMALESMLKESMDRLGNLSLNAYQLESRVRDLADENVAQDREKVLLLNGLADAEKLVVELRSLRKAEGRANERVMSIVAAKEQDWLKEKRNLQKEIEKLKETMNGMTREAKFQARRCRNPTCEHCKGADRVARNVKGRISLRELHSLREASQAPVKRMASPQVNLAVEAPKVIEQQEMEENRVPMKAIEFKKKQRELSKAEKNQQAGGIVNGSSHSASKELLVKQQQDVESELANILKGVGMQQKSYIGGGASTSKEATDENVGEYPVREIAPDRNAGKGKVENAPRIPEINMHYPNVEAADCFSEEDSDFVELEKAFELRDDQEVSSIGEDDAADNVKTQPELVENTTSKDGGIPTTATNEQQDDLDVDEELLALQERSSLVDGLVLPYSGNESNESLDEAPRNVAEGVSATVDPTDLAGEGERASLSQVLDEADPGEQEHTPEATANLVSTDNGADEVDYRGNTPQDGVRSIAADGHVAGKPVENTTDDEQVLGVIEDEEDGAEFSDASSSPLDPDTCILREESDSSAGFEPGQDHTEYGSGMDVKENWGFEDPVSSSGGEVLENQDIPVFERNNTDDDLAGELPEPEEKRVCGPPETLDSSEAFPANELSSSVKETSPQEGERLTDEDSSVTIEEFGSQLEEDLSQEKIGLAAADAKPKSDSGIAHSQDHLEPADFVS